MIPLGRNVTYDSVGHVITARDEIPDTVAIATGGSNLADIVDMPWVRDANVITDAPTVGRTGTVFRLREALVPLAPIPESALRSQGYGGPSYAPWIVTTAEREALDAVDAEAHRSL